MMIRRVILIDDNDDDNVFHARVLKRAAFDGEILVFEEGRAALDYFVAADLTIPTLVFLDINMPGMDGFEVAQTASPLVLATPTVFIVMLTSSSSDRDRERAEGIEAVRAYLTKPLTVEAVSAMLRNPPA